MTTYIAGGVSGAPAKTIEGVTAPGGDIDLTSTGATIAITGNDANDTINLEAVAGAGLPTPDTQTIIEGSADDTKLLRFEIDGFTTGTTRVITPPDKDITLDDIADTRTPASHALGGAEHNADTLANLNSKLSDATLTETEYNDGGEVAGADRTLGNTDAFALEFLTNNVERIHIDSAGKVGIATATPNAPLDVTGVGPGSVGGFPSGSLHVTSSAAGINDNAVITGHNLFGGNKQLWYLGSTSGSSDAIGFINRQNASLSLSTNSIARLKIEAAGNVIVNNNFQRVAEDKVIASTTQTQAAATQLTQDIVEVGTVAVVNDAVKLFSATSGAAIFIRNNGAKDLQIFPAQSAGDTINDGAVDASITLAAGASIKLYAIDGDNWYS